MKVVNVVPIEKLDLARAKMVSALDWSLQRWIEEGNVNSEEFEEEEIRTDDYTLVQREVRRKRATVASDEEEEEESDEEDDEVEEEANVVVQLGESESEKGEAEQEEEDTTEEEEEEELDEEVLDEVIVAVMADAIEEAETEALNLKASAMALSFEDMAMSPEQVAHGCSPVGVVEAEREGEGIVEPRNVEEDVQGEHQHRVQHPVGSFSSGIPSTPGRGFVEIDTSRRSDEQIDVQPMHVSDEEDRMEPVEEEHEDVNTAIVPTSKPSSRSKVKAPRKGKSSLRPREVGDHSRSSDAMEHSGLDREVESGRGVDVADELVDIIMSEAEHVEPTTQDLKVTSPVEEVAAVVMEVLGQGRPSRETASVAVAEEPSVAELANEPEVVVRTEVICLDSDDEEPEKRLELDVRVKVRDPVPRRVRGTFADYITDDSEDEDYGTPGYKRAKLNFIDDPHPLFAARPDTGKESDGKEKVHFAPFVDKYLVEVPENVRLNLAHLYRSYDYHKMFAYLSTPAFCAAVKVKHVLHAASLKKMRKRWIEFEAPKHREGRGQFPGSSAAQAGSVVESTLEIIDVSGAPESPRREVHAAVAESSSPHVVRTAETLPASPRPHDDTSHAADPLETQAAGNIFVFNWMLVNIKFLMFSF